MCCISFASDEVLREELVGTASIDMMTLRHETTATTATLSAVGPREHADVSARALQDLRAAVEVQVQHVPDEVRGHANARTRAREARRQPFARPLIRARARCPLEPTGELLRGHGLVPDHGFATDSPDHHATARREFGPSGTKRSSEVCGSENPS